MRQIGQIDDREAAERFRDYLLNRGIESRLDGDNEQVSVWVLDEDRRAEALSELEAFRRDPQNSRYAEAAAAARRDQQRLLDEQLAAKKQAAAVRTRRRIAVPTWGVPVTIAMIVFSGMAAAATNFGDNERAANWLYMTRVVPEGGGRFSYVINPMLPEVQRGEVWRLVTPAFLHMSVLHLVMNMYMLYMFGGAIEFKRGSWRFAIIVLFIATVSNLAQFFYSGPLFGGMSGVDFGLFGYAWFRSRFLPREGFRLDPSTVAMLVGWLVMGMLDLIPGIAVANACHVAGLLAGIAVSALSWRPGRTG